MILGRRLGLVFGALGCPSISPGDGWPPGFAAKIAAFRNTPLLAGGEKTKGVSVRLLDWHKDK